MLKHRHFTIPVIPNPKNTKAMSRRRRNGWAQPRRRLEPIIVKNQRISISKSCVNYGPSPNSAPYPHEWQHCRNVASLAASDVSSCIKVSPNSITTRDLVNYITSTGNGTKRRYSWASQSAGVLCWRPGDQQMKLKKKKKKHYGIT